LFVFWIEREDSINDGWYASDPDTMWHVIDYPASYHGTPAGYSFAEVTPRFTDQGPAHDASAPTWAVAAADQNLPNDLDILWMANMPPVSAHTLKVDVRDNRSTKSAARTLWGPHSSIIVM